MKVLVTEKISVDGINYLEDAGYLVDVRLDLSPEQLKSIIPGYEALIVRSATQVTADVIEAATKLRVIGRAGVAVDNIDVSCATQRGIIVCNAPLSNVVSAAEQTMALMLAVARHTPQANASMHEGKWERGKFVGSELADKTLAIVGLGRVGGLVAERAAAFKMRLIGYDPYCSPERAAHLGVTLYDDIMDICRLADIITVHLPKAKDTIGMFGPDQYMAMKTGVLLIDCAFGGVFNIDSMADFVAAGKIGGAGIDVYASEPCTSSPLHEFDNVILTPHLGASTREAQARAGRQIAEYVALGLDGGVVPTAINVAPIPAEVMEAVSPYTAACQVAGAIIAQVARGAISSLDVDVRGKLASFDVHVLGTAALRGIFSADSDEPVNFVNADYIAEQRGITVHITKDVEATDFANVIRFKAHTQTQTIDIAVTASGADARPRIVEMFGYDIDLVPGSNVMIIRYDDKPGQVGIIGTLMGKHHINISSLKLGAGTDESGKALLVMNLDQDVPAFVCSEIEKALGADGMWFIRL